MEYNWASYYRKAYENEKKKNTVLAGKTADAETKRAELKEKYEAICANPLYKTLQLIALPVRVVKKTAHKTKQFFKRGINAGGSGAKIFWEETQNRKKASSEELLASYKERLTCRQDSYELWMKEEEPALWEKWERLLQDGKKDRERRKCLVISYHEMAGVTALSQITEDAVLKGEERADILLFAEKPKELDERAVSYIERWFQTYPETKLFYGTQDHIAEQKRHYPWFKPCWSPDTLLGFFYFGSYFAVDRAWAEQIILRGHEDARQNLYDFMLRLVKPYFIREKNLPGQLIPYWEKEGEAPPEIVCTELILYHKQSTASFDIPADREYYLHTGEMKKEVHTEFWGYEKEYAEIKRKFINNICYRIKPGCGKDAADFCAASYQTSEPETWAVVPALKQERNERMQTETPLVSVIIPSKNHPELIKNCIGSFLERTNLQSIWGSIEFIVVDNGSDENNKESIRAFLDSLHVESRYLYEPMPFNFSKMCNMGAKEARGEFILLLNDDMEIIEENWLRILLGQAILPGVGTVGAKLWYPEYGKIQHAGVTNLRVGPGHKLGTFPDDRTYYYGHNTVMYDMIAVTAACLLVRRELYLEAGGLDEEMEVAYNDVEFCFKLLEAGYRNVLRNDAVLLHHESLSRGQDGESEEKWLRLLHEKEKLYKKHPLFLEYDPYYSRQLAGDASDYRVGYPYPYERPILTALPERREEKRELAKVRSDAVKLTMEHIGNRKKLTLDEPDILEIKGWCYLLGQDNALMERILILEAEQGNFYYQVPIKECRRPDVEAVFSQQTNVALSGFTCRILKADIAAGSYIAGMLYRNALSGKLYYGRSEHEKKLDIESVGT